MPPESGIYNGVVTKAYAGVQDTKQEAGVPVLDLKFDVTHFWNGTAWVGTVEKATVRLWLNTKGEEVAFAHLAKLGWNGDMMNAKFNNPQTTLNCWKTKDGYYRWSLDDGRGGSGSGSAVDATTAAKVAARFAAVTGGRGATPAAPAVPQPAVAAAVPAPAAPATTSERLGGATPAPPGSPQVLPGQDETDDIPF